MGRIATFDLLRFGRASRPLARVATGRRELAKVDGLVLGRILGTGRTTAGGADLAQWAVVAVWEDVEAHADFLALDPLAARWQGAACERWSAVLAPRRAHGAWDGVAPFREADLVEADGPVAVLTRARVSTGRWRAFSRARPAVDALLPDVAGLAAVVGMGEWPVLHQATFSLWSDAGAARRFAYASGAHAGVVDRTRRERWYKEELFATFAVRGHAGTWGGRDPLTPLVRLARREDLGALREVEDAAGELFDPYHLAGIDTWLDPALTTAGQAEGRLWVADLGGVVVGFALAMVVDGEAHLREIDVLPAHGRGGTGTRLVEAVLAWAGAERLPAVTLTTFTHIPWNAPWYARLGFEHTDELGPGLRQIVEDERAAGLDMGLRTVMRRGLGAPTAPA